MINTLKMWDILHSHKLMLFCPEKIEWSLLETDVCSFLSYEMYMHVTTGSVQLCVRKQSVNSFVVFKRLV